MRIAWVVPRYLPAAPCGAEWTAHELLVELARRGHEASAIVAGRERDRYPIYETLEGVAVRTTTVEQFDVVIGHLGYAEELRRFVAPAGRVVWMAHAAYQYDWGRAARPDHWIANAEHVLRAGPPGTWIMRPHTPRDRVVGGYPREGHGDAVLLVGASDLKGLPLVRRIARSMPWRSFIVVQSGYDRQRIGVGQRANIDVWTTQADGLRDAFAESRLLLVPSVESWGRVAVEAGHCGIPTIAHPSAGVTEALGAGGYVSVDREDLSGWLRAIERFDDGQTYKVARIAARNRASHVQDRTAADRDRIVRYLEELAA